MKTSRQLIYLFLCSICLLPIGRSTLLAQSSTNTSMARTTYAQGATRPNPAGCFDGIHLSCGTSYGLDEEVVLVPAKSSFLLENIHVDVVTPNNNHTIVTSPVVAVRDPNNTSISTILTLPAVIDNSYYDSNGKVRFYISYGVTYCLSPTGEGGSEGEEAGSGEPVFQFEVEEGAYDYNLTLTGKYAFEGSNPTFAPTTTFGQGSQMFFPMPGSGTTQPLPPPTFPTHPATYVDPFSVSGTNVIEMIYYDCPRKLDPYDAIAPIPGGSYGGANSNRSGITASEIELNVQLYPNPTHSSSIMTFELFESSDVEIAIQDLSGKQVGASIYMNSLAGGVYTYKMDTESLGSGIYIVQVKTDNYQKSLKLFKN